MALSSLVIARTVGIETTFNNTVGERPVPPVPPEPPVLSVEGRVFDPADDTFAQRDLLVHGSLLMPMYPSFLRGFRKFLGD